MAAKNRWIPKKGTNAFLHIKKCLRPPYVSLGLDVCLAALSLPMAMGLRLGETLGAYPGGLLFKQTLGFTLLAMGSFLWTQSYQGVWRAVSVLDLLRLGRAVVLSMVLFLPFLWISNGFEEFPQSALVIQGMLLAFFLGGARLMYRAVGEHFGLFQGKSWVTGPFSSRAQPKPLVLLVGTGEAAALFLKEIDCQREPLYQVVGLLSTKPSAYQGKPVQGVEILGSVAQWEEVLGKLRHKNQLPGLVILTDASLRGEKLTDLLRKMEGFSCELARLPSLGDLKNPQEIKQLRPLEVEDFFEKFRAVFETKGLLELIKGKRLLITGAGGTIGGELLRQLAGFSPAHLTLLDQSETLLRQAHLRLEELQPYLSHKVVLGDVRQKEKLLQILAEEKPDLVFHAAALKHPFFGQSQPFEAILTNVLGTCYLADACLAHQVEGMVLVSTDQAAHPSSLVAATKRLAESYCQALDGLALQEKAKTRFVSIRFSHVLASAGSVMPLFAHQIAQGGPVTLPHPQMKRPLMPLQETVELFLQGTVLGMRPGTVRGKILTLDRGPSVSLLELAETMIRLAGFVPHRDIALAFTGLRAGDALSDASLETEALEATACPQIWAEKPKILAYTPLVEALKNLEDMVRQGDRLKALRLLSKLVPGYQAGEGDFHQAAGLPYPLFADM
jgi:FlaA1/EpsC-like NDP-sugar epimerase